MARVCKTCAKLYSCWSHPSNCPLDQPASEAHRVCRKCRHILTYAFCPNGDCFYSLYTQDKEETHERIERFIETQNDKKYGRNQ